MSKKIFTLLRGNFLLINITSASIVQYFLFIQDKMSEKNGVCAKQEHMRLVQRRETDCDLLAAL